MLKGKSLNQILSLLISHLIKITRIQNLWPLALKKKKKKRKSSGFCPAVSQNLIHLYYSPSSLIYLGQWFSTTSHFVPQRIRECLETFLIAATGERSRRGYWPRLLRLRNLDLGKTLYIDCFRDNTQNRLMTKA